MPAEMKESFQKAGEQVRQGAQNFSTEAGPVIRRTTNGFGHAIGVLFKAFFLFIAGVIAFALITALIALAVRGHGVLHLKDYLIYGSYQYPGAHSLLYELAEGSKHTVEIVKLAWLGSLAAYGVGQFCSMAVRSASTTR